MIAEERSLSVSTIQGHLAYYVGKGEIPINKLLSHESIELILSHLAVSDDLKMGPVKAALGEKVSWSDIRFVVSHIKFLRKAGNDI